MVHHLTPTTAFPGYDWWAELAPHRPQTPDQEATLAAWFLHMPGVVPAWHDYLMCVIHLRPLPGVPPAHIAEPEASHELMVLALDPDVRPRPDDPATWHHLVPGNVTVQFGPNSDEQARQVARLAAQAALDSVLFIEPSGIRGAREAWRQSIRLTAEHSRYGSHPGGR